MFQEAPGFEQRLSELQAQIDRLTISLQLWRDGQERMTPADERLSRFADDMSDVLQEWGAIGDRHVRAVAALERQVAAFEAVESRLHRESVERFTTFQRMLQHEWTTLRHLQFEPEGQRRDQAAELTQACITAASARGASIAPEPLLDTERELQQRLAPVVLATSAPAPPVGMDPPEHHAVSSGEPAAAPAGTSSIGTRVPAADPALGVAIMAPEYMATEEVQTLRTDMTSRLAEMRVLLREGAARAAEESEAQHRVNIRFVIALSFALALVVAGGAWWAAGVQRQMTAAAARLADVEATAARTAAVSATELAAARAETGRLAEAASRAAADTEAMGAVLSAPDLVRYGLTGVDGSSASAQLLWSRSRGLVLSATRLAAPPDGLTHQVWLLTESDAVSAGVLRANADGRGTLISGRPPAVPRPVIGVSITLEPMDGSPTPTGRIVALNRIVRSTP